MKGKKSDLFTAVLDTLCAVLWWFGAVRDSWSGSKVLCAAAWSIVAVVWWVRYYKSRKSEP